MKARTLLSAALWSLAVNGAWADMVAVYESRDAVKNGQFRIGNTLKEGVLIPADVALSGGNQILIGSMEGDLYKTSLLRLDNEIGLAILKPEQKLSDGDLIEAHKSNAVKIGQFVPSGEGVSAISSTETLRSLESFIVRIDGQEIGSNPIVLPIKSKKSKFKMDIIRPKKESVWQVSLKLESDPKLSFWNANKQTTLSDVPQPVFKYNTQAFFKPLADGRFVTIPVEVHFIKQEEYTWTLQVWSKEEKIEQKFQVRFEDPKKEK